MSNQSKRERDKNISRFGNSTPKTIEINGKEVIKPQWLVYEWDEKLGYIVVPGKIAEISNKANLIFPPRESTW